MNKDILPINLGLILLGFAPLGYSLPFTIVPQGTLPTSVSIGSSVSAKYTVTNNTGSTRSNNFVQYLPPHVTQVTTGSGVCGATFTLAPHGQSGDSCILSLSVSGAVNGSAPNPKDHLFVCFPNGMTCAGTNFPLNVSATTSLAPSIAGGQYYNGSSYFPMLARRATDGSWNYLIDSTPASLPSAYVDDGELGATSCTTSICIAAGRYIPSGGGSLLLAQSVDAGLTWSYEIDNSDTAYHQGIFLSTSCSGHVCIAGGYYSPVFVRYPVLAANSGSGASWVFTIDENINLPAGFSQQGGIYSVTCSGNLCLAGGNYIGAFIKYPSLAVSADAGATWTYAIEKNNQLPPSFSDEGVISSVSCDGQLCAVGGQYSVSGTLFPLLAVSTNAASSWTYKIDNDPPTLPSSYQAQGVFIDTSCSGTTCVAGGQYSNGTLSYPMLSVSTNGGGTWSYKVDSATLLPLDYAGGGKFYKVICSGQVCIAVGQYNDNATSYPMLVVSTDAGQTWSYKIDKTPSTLPPNYLDSGIFRAVSCSGLFCTAGGSYATNSNSFPLLAESQDGGNTWTYAVDNNPATLPVDYDTEGFFGVPP